MLVGGGLESMWQIRRASSLRPTPMVCIGRSHLGLSVDPSIRLEKGEEKKGDAELNLIKVNFVGIFKAWVSKNQIFWVNQLVASVAIYQSINQIRKSGRKKGDAELNRLTYS